MTFSATRNAVVIFFALSATYGTAASGQALLPPDAKIIETAVVKTGNQESRVLVLWMVHPKKFVRQEFLGFSDDVYGDHWHGPTRLSLIEAEAGKVINTVKVEGPIRTDHDFSIPFFVSKYFYCVPRPNRKDEGVPRIVNLHDYRFDIDLRLQPED